MKKTKPQLYAYLGIAEDGELTLYCSSGRLNPIGPRLEKAKQLPEICKGYIGYEDAYSALYTLQEHFDKEAAGK
jgi:hypothetical protein